MKFSLMSDLHCDHPQPRIPYDELENIVVIAGDTTNGLEGLRFLKRLERQGRKVIAVDGNHEHYSNLNQGRTVETTTARFKESFPSITYLGEGMPVFLCTNGWYFVEDERHWYSYMNDGRYSTAGGNTVSLLAIESAEFLKEQLGSLRERGFNKVVVVTHTAPCKETLDPRYEGHYSNCYYFNPDMGPVMEEYKDIISCWCHGHTHSFADKIVNGVRVVCNPRGYPRENPNWRPVTIEIA